MNVCFKGLNRVLFAIFIFACNLPNILFSQNWTNCINQASISKDFTRFAYSIQLLNIWVDSNDYAEINYDTLLASNYSEKLCLEVDSITQTTVQKVFFDDLRTFDTITIYVYRYKASIYINEYLDSEITFYAASSDDLLNVFKPQSIYKLKDQNYYLIPFQWNIQDSKHSNLYFFGAMPIRR